MSRVVVASVVAALMFAVPVAALAQSNPPCAKRAELLKHLERKFKETPVAIGVTSNGVLLEVLAAAHGETWTVILSHPNGVSCLVAAGEDWESLPQIAAREPEA